jgi:hypothetical protein
VLLAARRHAGLDDLVNLMDLLDDVGRRGVDALGDLKDP